MNTTGTFTLQAPKYRMKGRLGELGVCVGGGGGGGYELGCGRKHAMKTAYEMYI